MRGCGARGFEERRITETADARVLSLADVFLPPPIDEEVDNTFPMYVPAGVKRAHERAEIKLKQAGAMATRASETIEITETAYSHVRPAIGRSIPFHKKRGTLTGHLHAILKNNG